MDKVVRRSRGPNLSPKQQRALETLLVGGSDQQAADAAGAARSTVTDWKNHHPAFIEALATARREMLKRTTSRLHAATALAVRALEEVAKDPTNPVSRVAAARAILEFSYRARELEDIEERLTRLEKAQEAPELRVVPGGRQEPA